jgi:DNA-binding GntR family transcriptional regulator
MRVLATIASRTSSRNEPQGIDLAIQPVSVLDQAAERLRRAIMIGELKPGQRLTERYLCTEMGISRPSVRAVLRRLQAEQLITIIPNRGPSIAKLSWTEIEEIHEVWEMLTGEATGRFADIVTDDDIRRLEAEVVAFKQAAKANDAAGHIAATNRFFRVILVGHNQILNDVIASLLSRINFLRAQSMRQKNRARECAKELEKIVAALKRRNRQAAKAATIRHIAQCCTAAREVFDHGSTEVPPAR